MAVMIKILRDEKPICVYDGQKWRGNIDPGILSEAIEIIALGLKDYRQHRIFRDMMPEKEASEEP